jgi:DNA-binding transcriptional LysR family regulator
VERRIRGARRGGQSEALRPAYSLCLYCSTTKLRQLEYLVTLADAGSFVQAARLTNVSQPSLSQQIRALEERLGVKLVDRGASGAILTPIGRTVVARARAVLADVREIEVLAARWSDTLSGTLRLGTTPTLGPYLLSPITPTCTARRPSCGSTSARASPTSRRWSSRAATSTCSWGRCRS